MYPNLRAEMARHGVTGGMLAQELNITESTFSLKLNGKYDFTYAEAIAIKLVLKSDLTLEELFHEREEDTEAV